MANLLIKKIQLGIPITMITGGTKAVKIVTLYPKYPIIPKENITPKITTIIDTTVALNDRKNRNNIKDVIKRVSKINTDISYNYKGNAFGAPSRI